MAIIIATDLRIQVSLLNLQPQTVLGLHILDGVMAKFNSDTIITSINDGKHKGLPHYVGLAADIRNRHLPVDVRPVIVQQAQARLGVQFDFVLEKDHFHLEFDPR